MLFNPTIPNYPYLLSPNEYNLPLSSIIIVKFPPHSTFSTFIVKSSFFGISTSFESLWPNYPFFPSPHV